MLRSKLKNWYAIRTCYSFDKYFRKTNFSGMTVNLQGPMHDFCMYLLVWLSVVVVWSKVSRAASIMVGWWNAQEVNYLLWNHRPFWCLDLTQNHREAAVVISKVPIVFYRVFMTEMAFEASVKIILIYPKLHGILFYARLVTKSALWKNNSIDNKGVLSI